MNRKKIIILIVTVVFAVSICGAHFMYGNYQRGAELAEYASQVLVPCTSFADNIEYNIRMFLNPEVYNPEFYPGYIDKYFFDYTLGKCIVFFGYEDMPLLEEDVRLDLLLQFEELRDETVSQEDFENLFTDEERVNEVSLLGDRLEALSVAIHVFKIRYQEMSVWERCFASWENERKIFSELIRIPQYE